MEKWGTIKCPGNTEVVELSKLWICNEDFQKKTTQPLVDSKKKKITHLPIVIALPLRQYQTTCTQKTKYVLMGEIIKLVGLCRVYPTFSWIEHNNPNAYMGL